MAEDPWMEVVALAVTLVVGVSLLYSGIRMLVVGGHKTTVWWGARVCYCFITRKDTPFWFWYDVVGAFVVGIIFVALSAFLYFRLFST